MQYVKLMDATIDGTNKLAITAGGAAKIDGSAVTQPVSGSLGRSWTLGSGSDSVSASVSNFPAGFANTDDVTDRAGRLLGVISAASLPLPAGAAADASLAITNDHLASIRGSLNDIAFNSILQAEQGLFT